MAPDIPMNGDGVKGQDGKDGYGYQAHAAQFSVNGMNGEHATASSSGGDAKTVHVKLARPPASAGASPQVVLITQHKHDHQCIVQGPHSNDCEAQQEFLDGSRRIVITARGGAGGNGGNGGNGQGGGHGRDGANANLHVGGQNGESGGNGGNGGDATGGSNGGKGGYIKIFVKEEDTDLLVALAKPDASGGTGGKAGVNGSPGKGGNGGKGGDSYTWIHENTTNNNGMKLKSQIEVTNPGGNDGSDGQVGASGRGVVQDGVDGLPGNVEFYIEADDGRVSGPYPSAYQLEVVGFDIYDGNQDGVIEFGEDLIVQNIQVRNTGGAPSPKNAKVSLFGSPTKWLDLKIPSVPMPSAIMSNSTVKIPGPIVFRIKPPKPVTPGPSFCAQDAVTLGGHFARLARNIPNFHKGYEIDIQHPIQMAGLKYLRCMIPGQEARFLWTLENISNKDFGRARMVQMLITEFGSPMLQLGPELVEGVYATAVPSLESRSKQQFEVFVKVSSTATPYKPTQLELSLHLTPPDGSVPVPIQSFRLPVQVSNHYQYDPQAEIFLVTNVDTSAEQVEAWLNLADRMGMRIDVWNVSLFGHLGLHESLLKKYHGKIVVLMGNRFEYFERGQRTVLDLIEKRDFAAAVQARTSFVISDFDLDDDSISIAARFLRSSTYPHVRHFNTVKALTQGVAGASRDNGFYETKFILSVKRGRDCLAKANRCSTELRKHVPNFRFAIMPTVSDGADGFNGEIEVLPCAPYDYGRFTITSGLTRRFDELYGSLLQHSLPFQTRIEMLWDIFAGDSNEKNSRKKTESLLEITEFDLINEMSKFIGSNAPWPDCIKKDEVLSHLNRVAMFLGHETTRQFSQASIGRVTPILGSLMLLADCCAGSMPRALTFGTRRKNVWAVLSYHIEQFLVGHYGHLEGDPARIAFEQYVREQSQQLNKEKQSKRKERLQHRAKANLPIRLAITPGESIDAIDLEMLGNIIGEPGHRELWMRLDRNEGAQLEVDQEHSKSELALMSASRQPAQLPAYS